MPPSELLPAWLAYLSKYTSIKSECVARSFLTYRLHNLLERELVHRLGRSYKVTSAGIEHLRGVEDSAGRDSEDEEQMLRSLLQARRRKVRETMQSLILEMDPIGFEHLIGRLLEAMGYTAVALTRPTNAKGVGVTAMIELGITSVKEVIQAKRVRNCYGSVGT